LKLILSVLKASGLHTRKDLVARSLDLHLAINDISEAQVRISSMSKVL